MGVFEIIDYDFDEFITRYLVIYIVDLSTNLNRNNEQNENRVQYIRSVLSMQNSRSCVFIHIYRVSSNETLRQRSSGYN